MCPKKIKIVLGLLLMVSALHTYAQPVMTDTTTQLQPVEIHTSRLSNYHAGYTMRTMDSITLMSSLGLSLADLLRADGWIYIKRYGVGGLGSVSMRGTSAVHTAVVWNGFSLQSPMNGGTDLNLFPVGFSDELQVQAGGACALFGSGAIGGSIHMNTRPAFNSGLRALVSANAGSYTNLGGQFQAEAGTQKTFTSVKGFYQYGKNDFEYTDEERLSARMNHAQLRQYGLMAGHHLQIGKKQMLMVNLWWQSNEREIPAAFYTLNQAEQNDQIIRGSAEWKTLQKKWNLSIRTLVSNENQHYVDSIPDIDSHNNFLSYVTEAESNIFAWKLHRLNLGINNTTEQVNSNNYAAQVLRNRVSLFAGYAFHSKNEKFKSSVSIREEYIGNDFILPVFSAGAEYAIIKEVGVRVAAARVYRIPTLNDLYWNPGGDLNLKPEQGWTYEAGLFHDFQLTKRLHFYKTITVYSYHINDWIVWLPSGAYWSPKNIQKVWSRGLESSMNLSYTGTKWTFMFKAQYTHTRATNRVARFAGDASVNKQLIYTPEYLAGGGIFVGYHGFLFSYQHHYTDRRYISSDNIDYLRSFQTGDIQLTKNFQLKNSGIRLSFGVDNLFNSRYLVIAGTPMPGRTYKGSITFQFHKPLKNN